MIIPLTEALDKSSYPLLPTVPQGLKPYVFSSIYGTTELGEVMQETLTGSLDLKRSGRLLNKCATQTERVKKKH